MRTRHSVRQYLDKSVEEIIINQVRDTIDECNRKGNLPHSSGFLHHFLKFDADNSFFEAEKHYICPINRTRYARI
ncbi:MAG: nitroreductase family protein [Candidatus Cryptobacteroides sp.]